LAADREDLRELERVEKVLNGRARGDEGNTDVA